MGMTYSSQKVTFGRAFLDSVVTAFKTAPMNPLINSGKLRLSVNPTLVPTPTLTVASLAANEADYTGYTSGGIAVSLGTAINLSGVVQGIITTGNFVATSSGTFVGNSVYGYWIDDGTNVILVEQFPTGTVATFAAAGDYLELVVGIPANANQLCA